MGKEYWSGSKVPQWLWRKLLLFFLFNVINTLLSVLIAALHRNIKTQILGFWQWEWIDVTKPWWQILCSKFDKAWCKIVIEIYDSEGCVLALLETKRVFMSFATIPVKSQTMELSCLADRIDNLSCLCSGLKLNISCCEEFSIYSIVQPALIQTNWLSLR